MFPFRSSDFFATSSLLGPLALALGPRPLALGPWPGPSGGAQGLIDPGPWPLGPCPLSPWPLGPGPWALNVNLIDRFDLVYIYIYTYTRPTGPLQPRPAEVKRPSRTRVRAPRPGLQGKASFAYRGPGPPRPGLQGKVSFAYRGPGPAPLAHCFWVPGSGSEPPGSMFAPLRSILSLPGCGYWLPGFICGP